MARIIRAVETRSPAPMFEMANGRQVQTRYLDAVGYAALAEYVAEPGNIEKLFSLVGHVVPDLTREEIDQQCSIEDCATLVAIGKGNTDLVTLAVKNGESGGESPAPPPTPPSNPTTT